MKKYIYGHIDEATAFEVDNYPWGYRLRTQQRYWIETVKNKGDRVVTQTRNPKTGLWCKPKKSTYSDIVVLFLDDNEHVKSYHFSIMWTSKEDLDLFLSEIDVSKLNDLQSAYIPKAKAVYKTREHITMTCEVQKYRHIVTGEIITSVPIFELDQYEIAEMWREFESSISF